VLVAFCRVEAAREAAFFAGGFVSLSLSDADDVVLPVVLIGSCSWFLVPRCGSCFPRRLIDPSEG
jgi:hypothetical protein